MVGRGLLGECGRLAAERLPGRRAVVVTSPAVFALHGARLVDGLKAAGFEIGTVEMPDGEEAKTFAGLEGALSRMARAGLDRRSVVVALGGGAIGDAAGFAAAVYLRGVALVQAPTTLLAMVDSSVGGKTAVNLPEGKNLAGAFHQPSLVVIDPEALGTLPARELASGTAEVIKYGAIRDAALFEALRRGAPGDWGPVIRRCCEIKARIVEADEFETGEERALLNFGHTIGHAIESAAFPRFSHGEAISMGMNAAAFLSVRHAGLAEAEARALVAALERHGLPVRCAGVDRGAVRERLMRDKKFRDGRMRFVLIGGIGEARVSEAVTAAEAEAAIAHVCGG